MRIVSVINYKGGVGKTTVTANLAAGMALKNKRVLMVDMDPQCSLTFSFMLPDEWENKYKESKTIKSWFDSLNEPVNSLIDLDDLIVTPDRARKHLGEKSRLDLISSHLGLINNDLELATQLGGTSLQQVKRNYLRVHGRLAEALKKIKLQEYDLVLIDCPPNFNITTKNAIVASDCILIPAKPDYLSTLGIDYLKRSLNGLVQEFNEFSQSDNMICMPEISPEIIGVVFTMIQISAQKPISAQRPYMLQTEKLGVATFENYFRDNKSIFSDPGQFGVPVVLNRYSIPTHSKVVGEIQEFVCEFERRLEEIDNA